jgi:crotonobetainyl-CoA:carnitine CoA-transferase CaiB-like acyl-CoA transferase
VNPGLIYCSITGFGQTGPYAHRAGYDYIIQGMSGIMSVTGAPEGQPQKVGIAVTDILTGLYSVNAILAALHLRDQTGRGQHIDMSLLDVATSFMANQAMNYLTTGQSRPSGSGTRIRTSRPTRCSIAPMDGSSSRPAMTRSISGFALCWGWRTWRRRRST